MDRLACVSLPAFPLQLLLRRHPYWAAHPVAVVEDDRPTAAMLWVNERARQAGVRAGLRYAVGLALAPTLRAGVVRRGEIDHAVATLTGRLMRFTPEVEPSLEEPGVFWLNAKGLERLYPSLCAWARMIREDLRAPGPAVEADRSQHPLRPAGRRRARRLRREPPMTAAHKFPSVTGLIQLDNFRVPSRPAHDRIPFLEAERVISERQLL